jgi:hypothetical protein
MIHYKKLGIQRNNKKLSRNLWLIIVWGIWYNNLLLKIQVNDILLLLVKSSKWKILIRYKKLSKMTNLLNKWFTQLIIL